MFTVELCSHPFAIDLDSVIFIEMSCEMLTGLETGSYLSTIADWDGAQAAGPAMAGPDSAGAVVCRRLCCMPVTGVMGHKL